MLPAYAFIKTYKVGGTTAMEMLERTLLETQNVTRCDDNNKTVSVMRPPPPGCRACLTHASRRQIASLLRSPNLVSTQQAILKVCPFWVPSRRVHTMIMLRNPVDRLYSRYHWERSTGKCRKQAASRGLRGCASDHYAFVKWAFASPVELQAQQLFSRPPSWNLAETVVTLGGNGGVPTALRVLNTIEVVGLTHRFDDTARVLSSSWGLPLHVLRKHLGHSLKGAYGLAPNKSFAFALCKQSLLLQKEQVLYNYASMRLTKQLRELELGGRPLDWSSRATRAAPTPRSGPCSPSTTTPSFQRQENGAPAAAHLLCSGQWNECSEARKRNMHAFAKE